MIATHLYIISDEYAPEKTMVVYIIKGYEYELAETKDGFLVWRDGYNGTRRDFLTFSNNPKTGWERAWDDIL